MTELPPSKVVAFKPVDFHQLPQVVILDLSDAIVKFQQDVANATDEHEFYVDEILGEALLFISQDWRANKGLDAFRNSVIACFATHHSGEELQEAAAISDAAMRLAETLLAMLRHHGLYASDGMLHYELSKNWIDNRTPVLNRHITLTRVKTG
ncbi:hypothetical protein D3C71_77320 [compost metagenome]